MASVDDAGPGLPRLVRLDRVKRERGESVTESAARGIGCQQVSRVAKWARPAARLDTVATERVPLSTGFYNILPPNLRPFRLVIRSWLNSRNMFRRFRPSNVSERLFSSTISPRLLR